MSSVQIAPWQIERVSSVDDFSESVFCVGNGRLGVRGFGAWALKSAPHAHGIFRAGLFSQLKPGVTDMVQLPDVLTLRPAGLTDGEPTEVLQRLNMRDGVLTQCWESRQAAFSMERAASMADERLLLQRLTIRAKEDASFTVEAIADATVANLPVHDDQTITARDLVTLLKLDALTDGGMTLHTLSEKRGVFIAWQVLCDRPCKRQTYIDGPRAVAALRLSLLAGESVKIEKRVWIDVEPIVDAKPVAPVQPVADDPWRLSAQRWQALWRDSDIELTADDSCLQGALRYNIFQLLCNNCPRDRRVSIGARGLTHGRYKGNTFWDTDIFMLPFFLWTKPSAARNLLLYRVDRLDAARALAKRQNLDGARFPWMCSDNGDEQCESWDIGLCEVHITADIAYAMERYLAVTGDESLLRDGGAQLLRDTARYWRARLTYEREKDRYSSFFVKGPDEYCGCAVNNTYTNYMARNNLRLAVRWGALDAAETAENERVAQRVTLLYDQDRNLYLQDEMLERLPPLPCKVEDTPSYKSVCFDRMQRYRALKQADLVLLATLFPGDFTSEQKSAIFRTYEPITVHDSTLSFGTHAQLALQLRLWDKAAEYLPKAVYLDLRDVMGNTGHEGVHMAALGAAWQAFVFGMAGLWSNGETLALDPHLPKDVRSMRFHVYFHGKRYRVEISHDAHRVEEEA